MSATNESSIEVTSLQQNPEATTGDHRFWVCKVPCTKTLKTNLREMLPKSASFFWGQRNSCAGWPASVRQQRQGAGEERERIHIVRGKAPELCTTLFVRRS
jgi:hypothetical protein